MSPTPKTPEQIKTRLANLIVLRDNMAHPAHEKEHYALSMQINELAYTLGLMEDAGGGALLPADEMADFPMSLFLDEQEVEGKVRSITDMVYHESGEVGSHEAQSLILSRVAQNLMQSMVIERQADWTKVHLGFAQPKYRYVRAAGVAYRKGRETRAQGSEASDCPYPESSADASEWMKGLTEPDHGT